MRLICQLRTAVSTVCHHINTVRHDGITAAGWGDRFKYNRNQYCNASAAVVNPSTVLLVE